ncbi:MAG: Dihydrofolate reductase [Candidatus Izimaplasma bacterium HR2]|nr:MAG: Dihydrofolate reductase [Candidatus Izimaplasma bacterium HR2]
MIILIAAVDLNNGLGYQGELLANIPEDMKHFKKLTMDHSIVMGDTTWYSLPMKNGSHRLSGRHNVILTRSNRKEVEGLTDFDTITDDINFVLTMSKFEDVYIIGGASVYKQFYQYADVIELTIFNTTFEKADIFFPIIDNNDFILQNQYVQERKDDFSLSFLTLVRRKEQ